jgi:glycosyltransferase involved in cell wall biosynthesis
MLFTIVTPAYNSEKYIGNTIDSVLQQEGHFAIEYFIYDAQSTDTTLEIVRQYQKQLASGTLRPRCQSLKIHFVSEPDVGMYDAINKGFGRGQGDIYAWINADDIYLPGAFQKMAEIFTQHSEVQWCKGITSYIDQNSVRILKGRCFLYYQKWIAMGLYGTELPFVQQDSVFWRADLWRKAAPIDTCLKLAGDFWLWTQFAKFAKLYSVNSEVSCFRRTPGQLSSNIEQYRAECAPFVRANAKLREKTRRFLKFETRLPRWLRPMVYLCIFRHIPGPLLRYRDNGYVRSFWPYYEW